MGPDLLKKGPTSLGEFYFKSNNKLKSLINNIKQNIFQLKKFQKALSYNFTKYKQNTWLKGGEKINFALVWKNKKAARNKMIIFSKFN